jgi:hypothetical protein
MKSNFLNLSTKDFVKGIIVAFITALLTGLYNGIEAGTFAFTWIFFKPIIMTSLGAMIAYLLKNFLSNSDDKFLKKE